jgi:phosphoglycolate phosphatase
MTKLIIFDLDGTLLDTIYDLAHSCNYALQLHRYPTHPVEAYRFFVGNGMNNLVKRALPEAERDDDTISCVKHDFLNYYFSHSTDFTQPYAGIPELLEALQQRGIALAVASNKIHSATQLLIERFFPSVRFAAVLGQREGVSIKPDPTIVNEILAIAGVTASEALYVGDSGVDVDTARNAGVPLIAVLWGFRPKEELKKNGATRLIKEPKELWSFVQ